MSACMRVYSETRVQPWHHASLSISGWLVGWFVGLFVLPPLFLCVLGEEGERQRDRQISH